MKILSIAAAAASVVLIALTLLPAAGDVRGYAAAGALVCAIVVLATVLGAPRDRSDIVTSVPSAPAAPQTPVVAPQPEQPPAGVAPGDIAAVGLLAALQEKGRLVDFLQDDVTAYSDAQVGAAARVVHAGCRTVLGEYFRIVPVRTESEGAAITIPAGYPSDEYRLVGKLSGQPPLRGTLMHRGWKTESVNLPRLRSTAERLPAIAPAEVEVR